MKKIETVSLIGLGAVGAAYGSKLHDTLKDSLQVVASKERIQRYENTGIIVNGQNYHFHYITPETKREPADLVLFAVKNADLSQAIQDARHHIGPDTIILSLLNGISSEEEIQSSYENQPILYSVCVKLDAVRQQNETNFSTLGWIEYGEKDNSKSENALAVQELFERAGIPYKISEDILHSMWWKFMVNVGINQTSAVLKAPYKVFQSVPSAYEWAKSTMREVVALSQKTGVHLTEEDVASFRPIIEKMSPDGKTSMLQDIEAGRKTEVEYLAGTVIELGKKYDVPTPINEQLFKIIHIMEDMTSYHQ
ncbi:ketopantoate reductase family protein [Niallia endozanthoxylica]|uniref:2-dehydropantoate 2-reductase n=1 Tax=Niallia endozanthoxylica TaxID=2036016 RepID=A0A5J5HP06_9BACI|nr:ketopantoate reductase family protein [Niallia endozanthoxylica]KAA9021112.1 ketopantoate reductase family protein [Niallia endozanthoxylica]